MDKRIKEKLWYFFPMKLPALKMSKKDYKKLRKLPKGKWLAREKKKEGD